MNNAERLEKLQKVRSLVAEARDESYNLRDAMGAPNRMSRLWTAKVVDLLVAVVNFIDRLESRAKDLGRV